jgi:hypothetical protein
MQMQWESSWRIILLVHASVKKYLDEVMKKKQLQNVREIHRKKSLCHNPQGLIMNSVPTPFEPHL